jgi:chemotaxis methyl-accepting protein methylase
MRAESSRQRPRFPAEVRDRVRFAVHDAEALDIERPRFDLVVCGWSL